MTIRVLTVFMAGLLSSCQTADGTNSGATMPVVITGAAAKDIAGDMAGRFAEHIGPATTTTISMEKDTSEFSTALEEALTSWGYSVVTSETKDKSAASVELAYAIDGFDGQVLARLSTQSIALGRAYLVDADAAVPAGALSLIRRN